MVPVVIGALGSISKRLGSFYGDIGHWGIKYLYITKECYPKEDPSTLKVQVAFWVEVTTSSCISTCICV